MYYDHTMHPDVRPTTSQMNCIQLITKNTGIAFYGKTKEQARQFISQNLEKSKRARQFEHNFNNSYNSYSDLNSKSENLDYDPAYDIDHRDDYNEWDSFENYIPY